MKRLVILLLLILTSLLLFAASEEDNGVIVFKGYIKPVINFDVTPLSQDSYNLLNETDLFPENNGLRIATWTLIIGNLSRGGPNYSIMYEYGLLNSETTSDSIEFLLIEIGENEERNVKNSGDSTNIVVDSDGTYNSTATIAVRYTAAGYTAAFAAGAATDYEANIKVTLLSD